MDTPRWRIWLSIGLLAMLISLLLTNLAGQILVPAIALLTFFLSICSWTWLSSQIARLDQTQQSFGAGFFLGMGLLSYWWYIDLLFTTIPELASFQHFYDLSNIALLLIACLPLMGIGLWLLMQHWTKELGSIKILSWILGMIGPVVLACFLFPTSLVIASSLIASLVFSVYIAGDRLSLTYLILWLLLIASAPSTLLANLADWTPSAISLFGAAQFVLGISYAILLRQLLALGGFSLKHIKLPLGGPRNFKLRIQLAFIILTLTSFLLIGISSYLFLSNRSDSAASLNILEQLLGVYAILLPLAGVAGIGMANSITRQISNIGVKLANTNLNSNEPLSWNNDDDELGRLVKNYNQMILDLEESAQQLAASERESAWREMAQQVAHEIKNPLTPMRLHIQQLVRLQKQDPDQAKIWVEKTAKTLLEQIDVLTRIASEFSHFAKLPKANFQEQLLEEILEDTANLFTQNESNAEVQLQISGTGFNVKVDRDQLQRVCINLVRNAIQAIPSDRQGQISLQLSKKKEQAIIQVTDNGIGIAEEDLRQIFQPRFTTKSTGSGLGLAMAKSSVEQMGGTIWVESQENQGSSFYISLPLVK